MPNESHVFKCTEFKSTFIVHQQTSAIAIASARVGVCTRFNQSNHSINYFNVSSPSLIPQPAAMASQSSSDQTGWSTDAIQNVVFGVIMFVIAVIGILTQIRRCRQVANGIISKYFSRGRDEDDLTIQGGRSERKGGQSENLRLELDTRMQDIVNEVWKWVNLKGISMELGQDHGERCLPDEEN